MAKFTDMKVSVGTRTSSAVMLTFHEDEPEENEIWVPLSLIEDTDVLDDLDSEGNCIVSIEKWFLKQADIEYDSDTDTTDSRFR